MSASRVRTLCPAHRDAGGCERFAAQILAGGKSRDALVSRLEEGIWESARSRFRESELEERISIFEVADCWRYGEAPSPSMERSVFLWQSSIGGFPLAVAPKIACPVERELFEAQRRALVMVVENHGGLYLRDALYERPSLRLDPTWPNRICAHARPKDRFLVRMPFFRQRLLLDELGISRIVLEDGLLPAVEELITEAHLDPRHPEWAWHLTAFWTTAATEDWARTSLGATRGPATRQ